MSIRKDLVIKISNGSASLDMPLQIYEKDHGIELRFKLMDYKYKYDKDPDNILNSNKEDILEAYTTIINPIGYELTQINGEVVDDTVKFIIEDSYTDELDELGIYKLQIHVKCKHSEFSIPPVQFEVLERLKGMPLYAQVDEGLVDYSKANDGFKVIEIVNGKLQLVWQTGEIITSSGLNAMVDYANSLKDDINEVNIEINAINNDITMLNNSVNMIDNDINVINIDIDTLNNDIATINNNLEAPAVQVEGSYISCDSNEGYAQNVEILGNTIQEANNLSDIRSVGDKVEGQELYEIPVLSTGKNLFDKNSNENIHDKYLSSNGKETDGIGAVITHYIPVLGGVIYYKNNKVTVCYYDNKKNFLNHSTGYTFTPIKDGYVRINLGVEELDTLQIEVGTVATEYEPYQEHKLTILSPVQLEKVGDVADKIICKDGVWGVEKNINTAVLNGSEDWNSYTSGTQTTHKTFRTTLNGYTAKNKDNELPLDIMSSKFKISSFNDIYNLYDDLVGTRNTENYIYIKSTNQTIEDLKSWLKSNNTIIKYQLTQPTFIPLPHDQQIKLRTFANKTNIHFGCEIEGTIKAQVPKSLGATVNSHSEQIGNLSKELDRVKKLEESTVSTVVTESDFTTVTETSNGYFEDIKLEGRTLVNLVDCQNIRLVTPDDGFAKIQLNSSAMIKPDTTYTVIYERVPNVGHNPVITDSTLPAFDLVLCGNKTDDWSCRFRGGRNDQLCGMGVITTPSAYEFKHAKEGTFIIIAEKIKGCDVNITLTVLEGDHTQNPPSYFEGLKSVGQDVDEISVLSSDTALPSIIANSFISNKGVFTDSALYEVYKYKISGNKLVLGNIKGNGVYSLDNASGLNRLTYINFKDSKDNLIECVEYEVYKLDVLEIALPLNCAYIEVTRKKSSDAPIILSAKQDKKRILYYNNETQSWEKPILRQWDSIEKHADGKYYYHQRSGEVVLNGNEFWELIPASDSQDIIGFNGGGLTTSSNNTGVVCDKFPTIKAYGESANFENIFLPINTRLQIRISKTKLVTQDIAGFKKWLSENNVTVVYQLAEEKIYECIDLDLITYAYETNLVIKSGVLSPKTTLKVHGNIGNVFALIQKKVLKLEDQQLVQDHKITNIESQQLVQDQKLTNIESNYAILKNELEAPAVQVEGPYISCDSTEGYAQNVEILGNTIQDADNLADIRSVGDKIENQELYEIPVLSCGKNLFNVNSDFENPLGLIVNKIHQGIEITRTNGGAYQPISFPVNIKKGVYYINFKQSLSHPLYFKFFSHGEQVIHVSKPGSIIFDCDIDELVLQNEGVNSTIQITEIQLEEGTVATQYEPYQEHKLTILSPVQLEKVGDVVDKIIYKDSVWGVEKNVKDFIIPEGTVWSPYASGTGTTLIGTGSNIIPKDLDEIVRTKKGYAISSKYSVRVGNDVSLKEEVGIYLRPDNGYLYVKDLKSNYETYSELGSALEMSILKYPTTQPTFIPLPQDQQVKLRTFANKTNISFLTEIEGTIKAQVPKSLGATVNTHTEQIGNLSKELDRVKKLEESTVSTVVTESDFTTVENTSNGYFEDVKLEGRTLVNLTSSSDYITGNPTKVDNNYLKLIATGSYENLFYSKEKFKPNTEYTIILDIRKNTLNGYFRVLDSSNESIFEVSPHVNIQGMQTGLFVYTVKTRGDFNSCSVSLRTWVSNTSTEGEIEFRFTTLENEYSKNPPSYFEGLKSVGQDVDEISVLSADGRGNLFSADYWEVGFIGDNTGAYTVNKDYLRTSKIRVMPNTSYTFKGYSRRIFYYDVNGNFISRVDIGGGGGAFTEVTHTFTTPTNCSYIALRYDTNHDSAIIKSINEMKNYNTILCKGSFREGLKFSEDKKRILYYNDETQSWEKPILRQWDTIEKHADGKYYYHKRSEEVVLNGSENYSLLTTTNQNDTIAFQGTLKSSSVSVIDNKNNFICDRFTFKDVYLNGINVEGINVHLNYIRLSILKSKLSTQDAAGFKVWLQDNPTTVVYLLAQEEVYECINIDLITYENETNFIVNTGAISPKSTLNVLCNITNVVRELQQKVSNLENYIQHVMIDALNNALNE